MADRYMIALRREAENLSLIKLTDRKVAEFISELVRLPEDAGELQKSNTERLRRDISNQYFDAPDLRLLPKNGWRFINAVSDFATHAEPLRRTANHSENLFTKTIDGHPMIDRALQLLSA
jgi:hypothetical protein